MATEQSFADHIAALVAAAGVVSVRKMFGEYGLYCDGRMVGLICDNQLFLKPTPGALMALGPVTMAPPYPGAKPHVLIDAMLDDGPALTGIIAGLAAELPAPKPKPPKARKPAG